jgi:repressor LexA
MDVATLRALLRQRGIRQAELAAYLGIDQPKVSKILRGERQIKAAEMDRIRSLLTPGGAGAGAAQGTSLRAIPIIGQVAAGNWKQAIEQPIASLPSPDPSIPAKAFALRVSGDSMDRFVDDGATVIVDPDDRTLYPGRFYVVLNDEGETTFKQFQADPPRLVPCSSNPAHREIAIGGDGRFDVVGRVIWRASRM